MLIIRTIVASAMAVISQFKKNLIIEWKGLADYKDFLSKSWYILKGLKI